MSGNDTTLECPFDWFVVNNNLVPYMCRHMYNSGIVLFVLQIGDAFTHQNGE